MTTTKEKVPAAGTTGTITSCDNNSKINTPSDKKELDVSTLPPVPDGAKATADPIAETTSARVRDRGPKWPKPEPTVPPTWANHVGDLEWVGVDDVWQRMFYWTPASSNSLDDAHVCILGGENYHADGTIENLGAQLDVSDNLVEIEDPSYAADLAKEIHEAARVLDRIERRDEPEPTPIYRGPSFPVPPSSHPVPKWATELSEWEPDGDGWHRHFEHSFPDPDDRSIRIMQCQSATAADTIVEHPATIDFTVYEIDGTPSEVAGDAREIASWLMEAADILGGPRKADHSGTPRYEGEFQHRITDEIRKRINESPLKQNDIAIAAGYGQDELSTFMCGRRLMDFLDLERIARVLHVTPLDLIEGAFRD